MKRSFLLIFFFLLTGLAYGQRKINGTVKDDKGSPIIGATVSEKSNNYNGAITDIDGNFELEINSNEITVSYIGFNQKNVTLTDNENTLEVTMSESSEVLDEVMVVGYGSSSKRFLTDNVSKLTTKDLNKLGVSNFQSGISGKAAGVRVNQTNGKLDGGMNIQIRGVSNISGRSDPLYVLDGMPLISNNESTNGATLNPLLSISPNDIESIDILKDASSAAIYGARAANGVVLITTKKGRAGKSVVSLNVSSGSSKPSNLVEWLNAKEYVELFTEAAINSLGEKDGKTEVEGTFDFLSNGTDWRNAAVDTDWNKIAFRDGKQYDVDFSLSGGDLKTQYYFGMGYNDTNGIVLGNDLARINGRVNVKHFFNKKFSAGMNIGLSNTDIERVDNDNAFTTPLQAIAQSSLSPAFLEDGTPNPSTLYANFLLEDLYANYTTKMKRVNSKVFGEYKIFKDLKINSDFGYDLSYQNEDQFRGLKTPFMSTNGFGYNSTALSENYIFSNYLTYSKGITNSINLDLVLGQEFNNSDRVFSSVTGTQFPSDDFTSINSAAEVTAGRGLKDKYTFLSYFTRASFDIAGKYFLKGSIRRDGSSRFGINNRYGIFPAVSAGWIVSEESFLKDNNAVSFLKLRVSYGQLGNSEIGNFASRTLYNGVSYDKIPGISLNQPGNNNLTWEKSNQFDFGAEIGILKNRLNLEFDIYTKNSDGLLFRVPLPASSGQFEVNRNIGSLESKGFEIVLNSNNVKTNDFQWTTNLNFANNTNKITSLPNNNADIVTTNSNIQRVGFPVNSFYLINFAGADPNNGDALFNKEGEGTETTNDYSAAKRAITGNPSPTKIAGLTNDLNYKGIGLTFTFVGEWGASIYNGGGIYQSTAGDYFDNQTRDQLKRWQKPGDVTQVPQARLYGGNGTGASTRYLEKADFIRLRNVMLSYSLPSSILNKIKLPMARIYLSGTNLFTSTSYSGYDPESRSDASDNNISTGQSFYSAPLAKTTSLGINVNF